MKILIAEDDEFLSHVLTTKLKSAGYEVFLAQDGVEAIDLTTKELPELILMDLIMPVKDGFEALKDIKANPATKHIPVVITSNLGQKEDINKVMSLGAKDYLVKSDLSIQALIDKIPTYITSES